MVDPKEKKVCSAIFFRTSVFNWSYFEWQFLSLQLARQRCQNVQNYYHREDRKHCAYWSLFCPRTFVCHPEYQVGLAPVNHSCNKWWSVANFYNAIDFNYMLNHLNRANKFKLRGFRYGSGHVHHVVCFMWSVCDFGNTIHHSRSLTASAIESTGSFKTFLHIMKRKAITRLQD